MLLSYTGTMSPFSVSIMDPWIEIGSQRNAISSTSMGSAMSADDVLALGPRQGLGHTLKRHTNRRREKLAPGPISNVPRA